jgi:phage-related minor tail protein
MSADLVAKLTLAGDASGIVGAATEGSVALDKLKASATEAGAAGGAMAPQYNAASIAVARQAAASDTATRALSASGAAKVDEIARLTQLASASSATTSNITALSAAHSKYNAEVNAARALLATGVITQVEYGAAVDASSNKLALANAVHDANSAALLKESGGSAALRAAQAELGEGAEATGVRIEGLTRQLEHVGASTGIGLGTTRLLVYGFRDLAAVAVTPVGGLVLTAAAVLGVVAAGALYAQSLLNLQVSVTRSNDALQMSETGYQELAKAIAGAANVSQAEGRVMLEAFLDGGAKSTKAVYDATAAVQGYATMTGETADAAAKNIGKMFNDPASAIDDLNKQYGLLDAAQTESIKQMIAHGDEAGAQEAVMDALRQHVAAFTGETTAFGNAWNYVKTTASDALGWIGTEADKLGSFFAELAGFTATAPDAAAAAARAQQEAYNKLSNSVAQYAGNYNHEAERAQIQDQIDNADALLKESKNATDTTNALHALAEGKKQLAELDKQDSANKQKLDDADRAHLDTIKHLIDSSAETIAMAQGEAAALQKEATASDGTAASIRDLQQAYDVQKKIQPFQTALTQLDDLYDRGKVKVADYAKEHAALESEIAKVTAATQQEIAAQNEITAKQDVRAQFTSLTAFYKDYADAIGGMTADQETAFGKSKQILDLDIAAANLWKDQMLAAVKSTETGYDDYASHVNDVFNGKIAKAYDDNLKRAQDWGSGVELAMRQMTADTQNWAKTSESLLTGLSTEWEDTFVKMVTGGQNALTDFFTWIEEQLLKLLYQKYMASFFSGLFSDVAGSLGDLFGLTGGGASSGGAGGATVAGGVMHSGGVVGAATEIRNVPAALFYDAPRRHSGGAILAPGEVPIIAKAGEVVLTEIQAHVIDAALARPVILQMPANGNNAPPVAVNIHQAPGTQATASEPKRGSDGSFSIDVLVQQIDRTLAQRSKKGRSAYTASLEDTHGLVRKPFG